MCLFLLSEIPSGSAQLDIHRGASLDFAMDRIVTYNRAAHAVGVSALRAAFRRYVFYYGTAGKGDSAVKAAHAWAAKAAAKVKARKERSAFHETEVHFGKLAATRARRQMEGNKILNLFDPGMRFDAFQNDPDGQMMDMYYGQAGNDHLRRDPVIGEFVHRAMGYVGNYGDHRTGRDAWFATFNPGQELAWAGGPVAEGWNRNQLINGTSGTVEISRIIRWGIRTYGGTLKYEGKQVYYSQVFDPKTYKGDTEQEALSLFPYFKPGYSSVEFDAGTLVFLWNGRETVPTHCHFLGNWGFPQNETLRIFSVKHERAQNFGNFHDFSAKKPKDIGALQHSALNKMLRIDSYLQQQGASINKELWDNFQSKPAELMHMSDEHVIDALQKCNMFTKV